VRLSESERIERTPDRAHENVNARTEKGFSSPAYTTDWRQLMTAQLVLVCRSFSVLLAYNPRVTWRGVRLKLSPARQRRKHTPILSAIALATALAAIIQAQAFSDDCSLIFKGSYRKALKNRKEADGANYSNHNNGATINVAKWFGFVCGFDPKPQRQDHHNFYRVPWGAGID